MAGEGRDPVAIKIEDMLRSVQPLPRNECCIYKVPQRLRKLNPDAYTPKIVSVGPFHRGNPRLLKFEGHKHTYCRRFLERTDASLDGLVKCVKELEPEVRHCYSEVIKLSEEEFMELILVDCCFTLELMLRNPSTQEDDSSINSWLIFDIIWDLLLIENQLPFSVFQKIYNLAFPSRSNSSHHQSFLKLASDWFSFYMEENMDVSRTPIDRIAHFTDLYRYYRLQPPDNLPQRGREALAHLYSATDLNEVGVKFKVNEESKCFFNLQFSKHYLRIPQFTVTDHTEMILRNMVAFEQCHYSEKSYFTDYVQLLDCLINTEKDVDILVNNEIIVNWLGDSKAVAKMFNGLCKNVELEYSNTNYIHFCKEVKAYYKHPRNRRMATLRRDYCNTPWKTVASIAAIALLILTIIQTICSILQVV